MYDDGFAFQFKPFIEKQSLRSVAINSNGVPELRFDISPQNLSLTEEDVAVICRIASKGERPNFTYLAIDESHPFYGRQYMIYDPPWLKGTSVGDVLSEVDWKMKCLRVGAQTDKTKSVYFSREKTSVTRGMATYMDFADDNPDSPGYIFTRCAGVAVQTYDDELVFCNDPKLRIDYHKSQPYSEYITRVLPLIAEHDESAFLKLQEIIKMILAAEWLKKNGIQMSKKWMKTYKRGRRTSQAISVDRHKFDCRRLLSETKESIPENRKFVDISMNEDERQRSRQADHVSAMYYGWYDNGSGEMVQFWEDGKCYKEYQSLRTYNEIVVTINGQTVNKEVWLANFGILLPNRLRIEDVWKLQDKLLALKEKQECSVDFGPLSLDIKVDSRTDEKGRELSLTCNIQACFFKNSTSMALSSMKITAKIRESTSDWDFIYRGLNPQKPMMPVPDVLDQRPFVPKETSWNELFSETVPWPRVWLSTSEGPGLLSATGGVRTDVIPTTEKPRDGTCTRKAGSEYSSSVVARHQGKNGMRAT